MPIPTIDRVSNQPVQPSPKANDGAIDLTKVSTDDLRTTATNMLVLDKPLSKHDRYLGRVFAAVHDAQDRQWTAEKVRVRAQRAEDGLNIKTGIGLVDDVLNGMLEVLSPQLFKNLQAPHLADDDATWKRWAKQLAAVSAG